jgi:hypothetical protein
LNTHHKCSPQLPISGGLGKFLTKVEIEPKLSQKR